MMKKLSSGPVDEAIQRILDLSAEAQIRRREMVMYSVAYSTLTQRIAAYGKALTLLTALQKRQESSVNMSLPSALRAAS